MSRDRDEAALVAVDFLLGMLASVSVPGDGLLVWEARRDRARVRAASAVDDEDRVSAAVEAALWSALVEVRPAADVVDDVAAVLARSGEVFVPA